MNQPPISNPYHDPNSVPPVAPPPMQGDGTGGIIPLKNPNALSAYYIGLFSLIPILAYVMGPMAIVLGIKGLKYAKQYPIVKGQAHAWVGIICGGLWTVVYYGFTLLMLVALLFGSRS